MRASRLLNLLLVLQRQGRTSAAELARRFEVSERTIRRDVEALGEAGVPILARRGFGGGIELVGGFRTHLTGLTDDEARCVLLVGQPGIAHRLGLGAPTRLARDKTMAALGAEHASRAASLDSWFVHDPDPWAGHRIPYGELRRLAGCIHRHRAVEITLGNGRPQVVRPLGLVLKAGSWHLARLVHGDLVDVVCIDDLRATRITRHVFRPPAGFDLGAHWSAHVTRRAGT